MDKLLEHKATNASKGNGYFCIFEHDDIADLAHYLHKEGKLEKVRNRCVTYQDRNFNYTVYKINE